MLLFIEGYPYELDYEIREGLTVERALSGIVSHFNKKEKTYSPEYVGYCYSKAAEEMIFFSAQGCTYRKTKRRQGIRHHLRRRAEKDNRF